jgi:hypothetical protein
VVINYFTLKIVSMPGRSRKVPHEDAGISGHYEEPDRLSTNPDIVCFQYLKVRKKGKFPTRIAFMGSNEDPSASANSPDTSTRQERTGHCPFCIIAARFPPISTEKRQKKRMAGLCRQCGMGNSLEGNEKSR